MKFLTLYFTIGVCFNLLGQKQNIYTIKYTKYSSDSKVARIIKDTTITTVNYKIADWTFLVDNDTLRIDTENCNCRILIYQDGKLHESLFDPSEINNDTSYFDWHQYRYNENGQLQADTYKSMNLPWMTDEYEYDAKGRVKKEISNSARYGEYSEEYIYDNEKLIMKIINDNNQIDTVKVKPK